MGGKQIPVPEDHRRAAFGRCVDKGLRILRRRKAVTAGPMEERLRARASAEYDRINQAVDTLWFDYTMELARQYNAEFWAVAARATVASWLLPEHRAARRQAVLAERAFVRWEEALLSEGVLPFLSEAAREEERLSRYGDGPVDRDPVDRPGSGPAHGAADTHADQDVDDSDTDADADTGKGQGPPGDVIPPDPDPPVTPVPKKPKPGGEPDVPFGSAVTEPRSRPDPPEPGGVPGRPVPDDPRRLLVELVEQAPPDTDVPLHVQLVRDGGPGVPGKPLRPFPVPRQGGTRVLVTVHAPGLLALGDLQQEVTVRPGEDSDVLTFGLRTTGPGPRTVTVRAFHRGAFLGEVRVELSVGTGTPARGGPPRTAAALAAAPEGPGEVTLQVLRGVDGAYTFQLIGETLYAPESLSFRTHGGDPRLISERVYQELRQAAADAGPGGADGAAATRRLRNLGVELWASAVPEAVRRQFWTEADRISSVNVLGEHDLVPWELLYPLDSSSEGPGFLAEWLPVTRQTFGQRRTDVLDLPRAAFVVPPQSPPDAALEVEAVRRLFAGGANGPAVLTDGSAVTALMEGGYRGLLHFVCHNSFTTERGSVVKMADGPFDPVDLAYVSGSGALRESGPLVFFNACRSAGEIDWFGGTLGWAPQFLRAGAGGFVGTLWPVRSDTAHDFARAFYTELLTNRATLGAASLAARRAVRRGDGDPTWLAYAVYGSPHARATVPAPPSAASPPPPVPGPSVPGAPVPGAPTPGPPV
ncbi:CHAT domain-containing protein [Streptomyces sp. JNUCC 64]